MAGKFPGFDSDTASHNNSSFSTTNIPDIIEDSDEIQDIRAEASKSKLKSDSGYNKAIQDKIMEINRAISEVESDYQARLQNRIKVDSKKIWEEQDYIEQVIREKGQYPEVHINAKYHHMNDVQTKMFVKTLKDIRTSLELLFGYL